MISPRECKRNGSCWQGERNQESERRASSRGDLSPRVASDQLRQRIVPLLTLLMLSLPIVAVPLIVITVGWWRRRQR